MLSPRKPFIAAHRGVAENAVENTLKAFERALALGADAIELDVHPLADGTLIVLHDDEAGERALHTLTRLELNRLLPDRDVPSFAEVAAALAGRVRLDVELKHRGIERAAIETLRTAGWTPAEFVVTSFDLESVLEVRRCCPEATIGWLIEHELEAAVRQVAAGRIDFAAPDQQILTDPALDACMREKVPVVAWTVNDPERIELLLRSPAVHGIITDRLSLALDIRAAVAGPAGT